MSFGGQGPGFGELLFTGNPIGEATFNANQQGIVLTAAMGNDDVSTPNFPAAYAWVIGVGATNQNDQRVTKASTGNVWGSNFGNHIDVCSPGIFHYSTRRSQGYDFFGGTSCATPFVSGVAGLILSQSLDRGLNLTNDDVKHLLEASADDIIDPQDGAGTGWDNKTGYGRINAHRALQKLSAPNTVTFGTAVGGTSTLTWNSHTHTFYNNGGGLATGTYYGVKQYKITKHVNFAQVYTSAPYVWQRERQTFGWNYANPNLETPWAKITNVTTTGFDIETVVYWIGTNSLGQQINAYYPRTPSQATVAYAVVGTPNPPAVYISGPTILQWKTQGTWTANASGGNGTFAYEWRYRDNGIGAWSSVVGTSQQYTRQMPPNDIELQVKVTSNGQIVYDTHYVEEGIDKVGAPTEASAALPERFSLSQNYPNPFNPETIIRFDLPEAAEVQLVIFDLAGREVRRLIDTNMAAGYHQATWNGKDNERNHAPSGVYVYQITAGNFREQKKLALVR